MSSITIVVAELTKSLVLKPKIDQVIHHTTKFVKYLQT